jgi:hypothetical protein
VINTIVMIIATTNVTTAAHLVLAAQALAQPNVELSKLF